MSENSGDINDYVDQQLERLKNLRIYRNYKEYATRVASKLKSLNDIASVERAVSAIDFLSNSLGRYDCFLEEKMRKFINGSVEGLAKSTNDDVVLFVQGYFNNNFRKTSFIFDNTQLERLYRTSAGNKLDILANVLLQAPDVDTAKSLLYNSTDLKSLADKIEKTSAEGRSWVDIANSTLGWNVSL